MRALIIPDVHLKPEMFDEVRRIPKDMYDIIVCLGDIVDDWKQQENEELYRKTLQAMLDFDKQNPTMLWCWGNHDFSYKYKLTETGFSWVLRDIIVEYLERWEKQCKDRLKVIHNIDSVLFSHAGLTDYYAWQVCGTDADDFGFLLQKINDQATNVLGSHGLWSNVSPLWARPQHENWDMYEADKYFQVVGHTPVEEPLLEGNVLTLDTYSTWSDGEPIGDRSLVVVDTETWKWKRVN